MWKAAHDFCSRYDLACSWNDDIFVIQIGLQRYVIEYTRRRNSRSRYYKTYCLHRVNGNEQDGLIICSARLRNILTEIMRRHPEVFAVDPPFSKPYTGGVKRFITLHLTHFQYDVAAWLVERGYFTAVSEALRYFMNIGLLHVIKELGGSPRCYKDRRDLPKRATLHSIRIPHELWSKIRDAARAMGYESAAELIRASIFDFLLRHGFVRVDEEQKE